jgi:hypothetical protein
MPVAILENNDALGCEHDLKFAEFTVYRGKRPPLARFDEASIEQVIQQIQPEVTVKNPGASRNASFIACLTTGLILIGIFAQGCDGRRTANFRI